MDAKFEGMNVPESVKKLREEVIKKHGVRKDDIEFTFTLGQFKHLGSSPRLLALIAVLTWDR